MPDNTPEMVPVQSSNVESIGHNPVTNELHVRFKGGGHYIYKGVDAEAHGALMGATSIGRHIAQHIKGRFTHSMR